MKTDKNPQFGEDGALILLASYVPTMRFSHCNWHMPPFAKTARAAKARNPDTTCVKRNIALKRCALSILATFGFWISGTPALGACTAGNPNSSVIESTPTANFTVNGDGTVNDGNTKLMWKQCPEGRTGSGCPYGSATVMSWAQALASAITANAVNGGLGFAGYSDWRVPNQKELLSLVEYCGANPSINQTIFPANPATGGFWSSSSYIPDPRRAWSVDFGNGGASNDDKRNASNTYYVRLVRGGQSLDAFDLLSLKTYTVTYDANGATGGTVPVDGKEYLTGATVTVLGNTGILVKSGAAFAAWNTQADGNGTSFAGGDTFSIGLVPVTLFAKWMLAPAATTLPASALTSTTATLNGTVSSSGGSTAVSFQYGRTTRYTTTVDAAPNSLEPNATNATVKAAISGLACNSTYHYRVAATNSAGSSFGDDLRFLTGPCDTGLTVKSLGNGIGTVASDPPGINCGTDCSQTLPLGTTVTLTATPPFFESAFSNWGGACAGPQPTCTVKISGQMDVTATFTYVGTQNSFDSVQDAYIAYYGRPADPQGRAYWAGRTDVVGRGLDPIISEFGYSDEFTRRYGTMTPEQLVNNLYVQVLARPAEQGGLDYWVGELKAQRKTLPRIAMDILYGVQNGDVTTVNNKRTVANYFSDKVAAGCPYGTEQDGLDVLAVVDGNLATVTEAIAIIDRWCGL